MILQSQPITGPVLSGLLQKGMNEHDIININHLIEISTNNIDNVTENKNTNKNISRSEYWKLFIDDLKKYGNIRVAIKERQDSLDRLQKEVNELNKQKQDVSYYLQISISFINAINSKISYYGIYGSC